VINVLIQIDAQGNTTRFDVKGHAGYDDPGKDIVCAAVSAIVQTTVIGLTEVIGLEIDYSQKNGNASCVIPDNILPDQKREAEILLRTMVCGLKSIQSGYSEFISVREKEVK